MAGQDLNNMHTVSWWNKLIVLVAILIPTVVSIAIGILDRRDYHNSGLLYRQTLQSRTTVQAFVHIVSSVLAFLWTFSITKSIFYLTTTSFVRKDVAVSRLRFWSAVTIPKVGWDMPFRPALVALAFLLLTSLPGVLWAGSLSPTITQETIGDAEISVPSAGPGSNYTYLWHAPAQGTEMLKFADCNAVQKDVGSFSNCPLKYNAADLVNEIASATSPDGNYRNHSKWDDTKFQYVGRSYGAGASVGLVDAHITSARNIQSYTYNEVGLAAETECIYNTSAATDLRLNQKASWAGNPDLYLAAGALPNSNWTKIAESKSDRELGVLYDGNGNLKPGVEFFVQSAFRKEDIVTTWVVSDDESHYFALAAGGKYNYLNKIQCKVTYKPTAFHVAVSTSNYTIKVTPDTEQSSVPTPDPQHKLSARALGAISPSFILTTLYVSVVGEAFMNNVQNTQVRWQIPVSETAHDDAVLNAVTDSVTAMIDGALVSLLSYGLVLNIAAPAPVAMTLAAVRIGSRGFILAIVLFNLAGLVAVVTMGFWIVRTDVPTFDYNDIGDLAIAVREGTAQSLMEDQGGELSDEKAWAARLHVSDGQQRPAVILKRAGSMLAGPTVREENQGRGFFTKDKGYVYEGLSR